MIEINFQNLWPLKQKNKISLLNSSLFNITLLNIMNYQKSMRRR